MNIIWEQNSGNEYQNARGVDEWGNKFFMPAHRETCYVTTPDGYKGYGWTAEEALAIAVRNKHNAILEEMKADGEPSPLHCQCGKHYQDCDGDHPITITAPPQTTFGDLVYWHQRASNLSPGRDIIATTSPQ